MYGVEILNLNFIPPLTHCRIDFLCPMERLGGGCLDFQLTNYHRLSRTSKLQET